MRGRLSIAPTLAALMLGLWAADASAHAALTAATPVPGATLGAGPSAVTLTFSERPAASLSSIRVTSADGTSYQEGPPRTLRAPLALTVRLRPAQRGVYRVTFRVVSAVDGHATAGSYAFGVGVPPGSAGVLSSTSAAKTSGLEIPARLVLILGLVVLLGASVAGAAGFGGSTGSDRRLAIAASGVSIAGVLFLAIAQRRTSGSSFGDLLSTPVGHALAGRGVAILAAGTLVLVADRVPRIRRPALVAAALATLEAMIVHVSNGHAAAGTWPHALTVAAQATHFAAAGIWFGGLAALLLGVRGEPTEAKTAAMRRFSAVALVALGVVLVTGTIRAIDELSSVGDLFSTGYGRAVLTKIALIALIAALGRRNRRRSVPAAATDLDPLRRTSIPELGLAVAALLAAAVLGALAPPVSGKPPGAGVTGLETSGTDPGGTIGVRLRTVSDQPGANRFTARVEDARSGDPVRDATVRLRFVSPDDPDVPATQLALHRSGDEYSGSGSNLRFDGRWRVTVSVRRSTSTATVPLELYVPGPKQFVSARRVPGQDPFYSAQLGHFGDTGYIYLEPHPERPGLSRIVVTCLDPIESEVRVGSFVLTGRPAHGPTRQEPVRRIGPGKFVATVELVPGPFTVTVVAHPIGGQRQRAVFRLPVPAR